MTTSASVNSMLQLQMLFPLEKLQYVNKPSVTDDYMLRAYQSGDEIQYLELMQRAGFQWTRTNVSTAFSKTLPDGLFFIIERKTGDFAATAMATHNPSELHPFGGALSWVAASTQHAGKKLGQLVCAAVLWRFKCAGYTRIYLNTDDFRIPAIKTYLNLGWEPFLFTNGMRERWENLLNEHHIEYVLK